MYHVTHVAYCRSPVICHLSLMPKATATDLPPANSPTMHSRMVGKDQKNQNKNLNKRERKKTCKSKMSRGRPNLRLRSLTRSLQSTGKRCLQTWTDRQTDRSRISQLIDWISLGADSLKIYIGCLKRYRLQHQRSRLVVCYLQNCVGRDEPVVSLGTNSEFIEYIAAVRGRITNCRKDNRINTFTLYSFSIFPM